MSNLTEQTQADLKSILEVIDQRVHELDVETTTAEARVLTEIRGRVADALEGGAGAH